ncbi:MAG: ferritin [Planctomycetota bacterium]
MKAEICNALNEHLKLEFRAWHEYAAMALWFERQDLPGFATFFRGHSEEELAHARRIIDHLTERDQTAVLPQIEQPRDEYDAPRTALEEFLNAEQTVTASIRELYKLAEQHEDQPARILLEWFVNEQVEEESVARAVLGRLKLAGDSGPGLLLVDQELSRGQMPGAGATGPE